MNDERPRSYSAEDFEYYDKSKYDNSFEEKDKIMEKGHENSNLISTDKNVMSQPVVKETPMSRMNRLIAAAQNLKLENPNAAKSGAEYAKLLRKQLLQQTERPRSLTDPLPSGDSSEDDCIIMGEEKPQRPLSNSGKVDLNAVNILE